MSEFQRSGSFAHLLIPATSGIALAFSGCGGGGGDTREENRAFIESMSRQFCEIWQSCYADDFVDEWGSFEGCVEYNGPEFLDEAYELSDACGEAFMKFARCAAPIWGDAYEARGCSYYNYLENYGATLVTYDGDEYAFPCPDEYYDRIDECGYL